MQFNVATLLKEGVGASRRFTVDDTFESLEETATNHARGSVCMTRTDVGIWVNAVLEATAWGKCSRCLCSLSTCLSLSLDEEYMPTSDVDTGIITHTPEEDTSAFTLDEHHILDLTEAVRQHAIINLPMKPLCRKECRGICATCGINLNGGQCQCTERDFDPRWSPLIHILSAN